MKSIFLKRGKEDSLKRFHPWIFSGAIHHTEGDPQEGEKVMVYTSENEYIATGHYQIGSIMVRVLTFDQEVIDQSFYEKRLAIAKDVRHRIGVIGGKIYGNTAVMQAHSVGMHFDRQQIANALSNVMGTELQNIYYKSETTLPYKAELGQENGFLLGGDTNDVAIENGLKFHVDWLRGQKTGFFVV